jgi:uncharacterized Ntn-hydrolase superfamily protein
MTFSIVARDRKTLALGTAASTGITGVGSRVPHVKKGVGAIATQALTEISYGIRGLELLEKGYTPQRALDEMLKSDSAREHRQVIIIDVNGDKAAFTGRETLDFKGHIIGDTYIVAGNMLANENVIGEMARAFKKEHEFAEKLLATLEAGKLAGGDVRGERSAALVIVPYETGRSLNLKVDDSLAPIKDLRRLFEKQRMKE